MKTEETQCNRELVNQQSNKLRGRAIDQSAIGALIFMWGVLLTLKQAGIIDKSVSTWPFLLTALGILLVIGGIYRLSKST